MGKTRREFIKLEIRLFNDDRFFTLNEFEQLSLLKILAILKQKSNKMPKDLHRIVALMRTERPLSDVRVMLKRLKRNFPNFKSCKHYYYWDGWTKRYNLGPDVSLVAGTQVSHAEKSCPSYGGVDRDRDIDRDKDREKKVLLDQDFIKTLKENSAYSHINIDHELGKMDAWLLAHKGRQKTRRFIVNWLNKIDKPLSPPRQSQKEAPAKTEKPNSEVRAKVADLIHKTVKDMKK